MTTNRATTVAGLVLAAALGLSAPSRADEWDGGADNDNAITTDNVMFHGSEQTHDLAGISFGLLPDQDWYLTSSRRFSSYEFVVDGLTGDLDFTPTDVQLLDATGTSVLDSGLVSDSGGVLSLYWLSGSTAPSRLVRVHGAACAAGCESVDRYRARFYDTTYTIPRFNNTGTQSTVLLVQNATDRACIVVFFFLGPTGDLAKSTIMLTIDPGALGVLDSTTLVPNLSGSVRIAHTCGYGGLSGKAVSIEPETGFTFDTQMLPRPH